MKRWIYLTAILLFVVVTLAGNLKRQRSLAQENETAKRFSQEQPSLKADNPAGLLPRTAKTDEPSAALNVEQGHLAMVLKYSQAATVAELLSQVFAERKITISADLRSNVLRVEGDPKSIQEVKTLIEKLDRQGEPLDPEANAGVRQANPYRASAVRSLTPSVPVESRPITRKPAYAEYASANEPYETLHQAALALAAEIRQFQSTAASNDENNAKLKAQRDNLRRAVAAAFQARQQHLQTELAEFTARMNSLQSSLELRNRAAEQIIERRVDELLNPNLHWELREARQEPRTTFVPPAIQLESVATSPSVGGSGPAVLRDGPVALKRNPNVTPVTDQLQLEVFFIYVDKDVVSKILPDLPGSERMALIRQDFPYALDPILSNGAGKPVPTTVERELASVSPGVEHRLFHGAVVTRTTEGPNQSATPKTLTVGYNMTATLNWIDHERLRLQLKIVQMRNGVEFEEISDGDTPEVGQLLNLNVVPEVKLGEPITSGPWKSDAAHPGSGDRQFFLQVVVSRIAQSETFRPEPTAYDPNDRELPRLPAYEQQDSTALLQRITKYRSQFAFLQGHIQNEEKNLKGQPTLDNESGPAKRLKNTQRELAALRDEYTTQLRLLKLDVEDAKQKLDGAIQRLELQKERVKAGEGPKSDLLEAEQEANTARRQVERAMTLLEAFQKIETDATGNDTYQAN